MYLRIPTRKPARPTRAVRVLIGIAVVCAAVALAPFAGTKPAAASANSWVEANFGEDYNVMVLDVEMWRTANRSRIHMWELRLDGLYTNQRWTPVVKGNDGFGGYMINLVGNQSSKCLDKSMDRGNVNFATVYIYTCSGSNNQLWDYRPVGDGWYQLRSAVDPSRCLTAASIFQDADVWVEDCHVGEGNQQWHIANFQ